MSVAEGRPEVTGPRSKQRDGHETDIEPFANNDVGSPVSHFQNAPLTPNMWPCWSGGERW
jgi:hypothetical protein